MRKMRQSKLNSFYYEYVGLTAAEHATTGAPQIVPNHSSLSALYQDVGLLVPANISFAQDKISTVGKLILDEDLAEKMELIYKDKDLYAALSQKGIEKLE